MMLNLELGNSMLGSQSTVTPSVPTAFDVFASLL